MNSENEAKKISSEELLKLKRMYKLRLEESEFKVARLQDLSARQSANKWSTKKFVRNHTRLDVERRICDQAINQINLIDKELEVRTQQDT